MPRSLADGRTKLTILLTAPVDPEAPTATELNAGIDASCNIMASDFMFGATDSDKVAEKALCVENNANSLGASNYQFGATAFRYFSALGASAPLEGDDVFQALKAKGAEIHAYARRTSKKSTDVWVAADEIYLGARILLDEPQPPSDTSGYIKFRSPGEVQEAWPWITAAAGI